MELNRITIMVRDIEKSIDFYTKIAGLEVQAKLEHPMGKIAFLSNSDNGIKLELVEFRGFEKVETKGLVLSFHVEGSLEEFYSIVINAGYQPSDIFEMPPKPKHFKMQDPDGVLIEFSN